MPLIKRYPNRKLYDTEAKKYIKLEEIAELIRQGEDVQVIDYSTGEDLTTLTLTQIILEEEKKQAGFLPRNVLSSLVKAGGETVSGVQRALATSLGWWTQFDEEIQRRLSMMVEQGELSAKEANTMMRKIVAAGETLRSSTFQARQHTLENLLKQRGIPTRNEVSDLEQQLEILESKISSLETQQKETEQIPQKSVRKKPRTTKKANSESPSLPEENVDSTSETGNP